MVVGEEGEGSIGIIVSTTAINNSSHVSLPEISETTFSRTIAIVQEIKAIRTKVLRRVSVEEMLSIDASHQCRG